MSRRGGPACGTMNIHDSKPPAIADQERPDLMDSGIDTAPRRTPSLGDPAGTQQPLRIGLMLRAVDDVDGQGIYIRELCDALFDLDRRNEYVALYWNEAQRGRYRDRPNV